MVLHYSTAANRADFCMVRIADIEITIDIETPNAMAAVQKVSVFQRHGKPN